MVPIVLRLATLQLAVAAGVEQTQTVKLAALVVAAVAALVVSVGLVHRGKAMLVVTLGSNRLAARAVAAKVQ
jgi:hypothetical protein